MEARPTACARRAGALLLAWCACGLLLAWSRGPWPSGSLLLALQAVRTRRGPVRSADTLSARRLTLKMFEFSATPPAASVPSEHAVRRSRPSLKRCRIGPLKGVLLLRCAFLPSSAHGVAGSRASRPRNIKTRHVEFSRHFQLPGLRCFALTVTCRLPTVGWWPTWWPSFWEVAQLPTFLGCPLELPIPQLNGRSVLQQSHREVMTDAEGGSKCTPPKTPLI